MDTQIKMTFAIAFFFVTLLLLLFDGAMATRIMFGGGEVISRSMGGINWVWLPILLVLTLDVVLFSGIFENR